MPNTYCQHLDLSATYLLPLFAVSCPWVASSYVPPAIRNWNGNEKLFQLFQYLPSERATQTTTSTTNTIYILNNLERSFKEIYVNFKRDTDWALRIFIFIFMRRQCEIKKNKIQCSNATEQHNLKLCKCLQSTLKQQQKRTKPTLRYPVLNLNTVKNKFTL